MDGGEYRDRDLASGPSATASGDSRIPSPDASELEDWFKPCSISCSVLCTSGEMRIFGSDAINACSSATAGIPTEVGLLAVCPGWTAPAALGVTVVDLEASRCGRDTTTDDVSARRIFPRMVPALSGPGLRPLCPHPSPKLLLVRAPAAVPPENHRLGFTNLVAEDQRDDIDARLLALCVLAAPGELEARPLPLRAGLRGFLSAAKPGPVTAAPAVS